MRVLAKGREYYRNKHVLSLEEIDDLFYQARVEGTYVYTVKVQLDDQDNIVDSRCDCPYDIGPYCKHQVAVFLALRNARSSATGRGYTEHDGRSAIEGAAQPGAVSKRKRDDIEAILSARTKDELVKFLLDMAAQYEGIRALIPVVFADGTQEDDISTCIALIRTSIRNSTDEHGFVSYRNTARAVSGADHVLEQARCALKRGRPKHSLELALCTIGEMVDLLSSADDSSGVVGGVVETSLRLVDDIVDGELAQADHEYVFRRLIEESTHERYAGWTDWRLDIITKCSRLTNTPVLRDVLEKHLVSMVQKASGDHSWGSRYLAEKVDLIRYRVLERHGGQDEAEQFIEENLQHAVFREMAIENALKRQDYGRVVRLAADGETKDRNLLGLVAKWKHYRYQASRLSGNLDEQRKIAADFILDGRFEYYKELKATYDKSEWCSVYPGIISLLENQPHTPGDIYTRILIEEGEKRRLLDYVMRTPSSVEYLFPYLLPEFKDEACEVFVQHIEQVAERARSRRDYAAVCAAIRKLRKAGGEGQASQVKQTLLRRYARRRAFVDELSGV